MDVLRARSSVFWGWLCVALGAVFAAVDVVGSGIADARVGVGVGASLALAGVAVYLRPAVLIGEDAVALRNVVVTATVPFARIQEVTMRWSLEILGDDGRKAAAFAAPASRGARTGVFGTDSQGHDITDDAEGRPDPTGSRLYQAWQEWAEAHPGDADQTTPSISRGVDPVGVALLVAAGAGLAFAALL
ncbi:hypothetical protein LGT39_02660 [Demequina sp. TTPB684]|uniref:hypothetical protein n=1 Tax=unclassified Demequina TaxID=2620311 RepID=UPI001CF356D4|nr:MULTISPECIES: hypothetical protein [unclassified Demequina]MCB2411749.1 hypothetical protein [Demequina sp. TTPB684]UPU87305.1 hypothetical protein LGT36_008445 [Demequina sp. TMPB413]